jgi:hypothetical protein
MRIALGWTLVLTTSFTLACQAPAGPSETLQLRAQPFHEKTQYTFPISAYDLCRDEYLDGEVVVTQWLTGTLRESGDYLYRRRTAVRGTVTAPDGTAYELVLQGGNLLSIHGAGTTASETLQLLFIGQGRLANRVAHGTFHTTINANGEQVVWIEDFWLNC